MLNDNVCVACLASNCVKCDYNQTSCLYCSNGYDSSENGCVKKKNCVTEDPYCKDGSCIDAYYFSDTACFPCSTNCKNCENKDICDECLPGYYLPFPSNPVCTKCDFNCKECKYKSTFCTSCLDGLNLRYNSCQLDCYDHQYLDNNKCLDCPSECM